MFFGATKIDHKANIPFGRVIGRILNSNNIACMYFNLI